MKIKIIVLVIMLTAVLSSCKYFQDQKAILPAVSGTPGNVLVVMTDIMWKKVPGQELTNLLSTPMEGLPQDEPMFDIIHINQAAFGNIFKQQRNIIITKIGSDQPAKKILVQKSVWAKSQLVITIVAPSDTAFVNLIKENDKKILALVEDADRMRLMDSYSFYRDKNIFDKLKQNHSLSLRIPEAYKFEVDTFDFVWLSSEYRDIIQGIFIYQYNYNDSNTFTKDFLIDKRNKFLKKYVSGEVQGSYMTTESLYPPVFNEYNLNGGKYTVELRGLWRMQDGLAMGGPFISITQLDEKRNLVVTAEGFVFAPAHKKRELLRQVEAIVLSLEIK